MDSLIAKRESELQYFLANKNKLLLRERELKIKRLENKLSILENKLIIKDLILSRYRNMHFNHKQ